MTKKITLSVINENGKVIKRITRILRQNNEIFYKGYLYKLRDYRVSGKRRKIIVLGTGYLVSNKKATIKSPVISKLPKRIPKTSNIKIHKFFTTKITINKEFDNSFLNEKKYIKAYKKFLDIPNMEHRDWYTNKYITDMVNEAELEYVEPEGKYGNGYYKYNNSVGYAIHSLHTYDEGSYYGMPMHKLAAQAFDMNVNNSAKDPELIPDFNKKSINELREIYSIVQARVDKDYPDGYIYLYRLVDKNMKLQGNVGDKVTLPTYNVSNWTHSPEANNNLMKLSERANLKPIVVMAKIPTDKILLYASAFQTHEFVGEESEVNILGNGIDSYIVYKHGEDKRSELYDEMYDEEKLLYDIRTTFGDKTKANKIDQFNLLEKRPNWTQEGYPENEEDKLAHNKNIKKLLNDLLLEL